MNVLLAMEAAVAQGMLWGIMAIGVFITFRVMNFSDLTVDGSFALGACVSIALIIKGVNPVVSLVVATTAGALAGVITGTLHTKLNIPAILSSILTMIALYSINVRILGRGNVSIMKETTIFTAITDNMINISRNRATILVGLIVTIFIIALLYWFFGTEIGCSLRATGNNEHMSKAQGVNTDAMKILGLAVSNGLVAFSGALVGQNQRFADVTMGTGTIVIGLASVVIGSVIIKQRSNFAVTLLGTSLGSMLYRVIIAVVLQLGLKTDDQKLFTAIIVAIALSIPNIKQKFGSNGKVKEAK